MEPSIGCPASDSSSSSRLSPPVIVDPQNELDTTNKTNEPKKPTSSKPKLVATSSNKSEPNKLGGRRLEKQAEVEETDLMLHEQHKNESQNLLGATSPTNAGGNFPELPKPVASLGVPGRPASFDSSSLGGNGSLPTPQNSFEKQSSLERPGRLGYSENNSPAISRDSSTECNPYTDYTGADLEAFLRVHLNKSAKDREVLTSIEQRLSDFVKQGKTQCYSFPQMSSYHRMFVHRVAALFGLDHNVDQTGKAVIVSLTANTRVPDFKFRELCGELPSPVTSSESKKLILKRDSSDDASRQQPNTLVLEATNFSLMGIAHGGTPASSGTASPRAASVDGSTFAGPEGNQQVGKTYEEREADYQKARRRIFNDHEHQQQQHLGSPSSQGLTAMQSWGSTDQNQIPQPAGPYMSKANSFGGTSANLPASHPQKIVASNGSGLISNAPTIASSPSAIGGTLVIPQPQQQRAMQLQPQPSSQSNLPPGAVYVLAPSIEYVTTGSIIVSPQTGETFLKRPDGSLQPVTLCSSSPSPTNAGSPVQAPQNYFQQQPSSSHPPQQQLSRYVVAGSDGRYSPGQQIIVGQEPNIHDVMNRLSIISSSDLSHYNNGSYASQGQQVPVQQSPQAPPVLLTSVAVPSNQPTQAVQSGQVGPFQIPNGQYVYQVASNTTLLTSTSTTSGQVCVIHTFVYNFHVFYILGNAYFGYSCCSGTNGS